MLYAHVLVVPVRWKLTITGSSEAPCSGPQEQEVNDKLEWDLAAEFKLDDTFSSSQTDLVGSVTFGTPTLCVKPGCGKVTSVERVGDIKLSAEVGPAKYEVDTQTLALRVLIDSSGPERYDVHSDCPGETKPVPFFGNVVTFDYGKWLYYYTTGNRTLESDVHPDDIDKRWDRVATKIHLKLEALCP